MLSLHVVNWNLPKRFFGGFPGGSEVKVSASNAGDPGSILGWEDPLEKELATHSSILAWEIPWTDEPGRGGGGRHHPRGHKESDTTERLHFTYQKYNFLF